MVMTCRHIPSTARLALLVLLTVSPQLAGAAAVGVERVEGGMEGLTRTHPKEDNRSPLHTPPGLTLPRPLSTVPLEQDQGTPTDMDPAQMLASVLLEALDHPGAAETPGRPEEGDSAEGQWQEPAHLEARGSQEGRRVGNVEEERWGLGEESGVLDRRMERLRAALEAAAQGEELREWEEEEERKKSQEERGGPTEGEAGRDGGGSEDGGEREEEEEEEREGPERSGTVSDGAESSLRRETRGYFQNIDLGLQDNEILPPLKGYKAYNTQLARAGKKLHWQEEQASNRPIQGSNFMDDFENEGEEEVEEEVESLTRAEEEARARADKQEVLRQQEEAEHAREEEQRLADIASDMLLQYMGRKQQGAPYLEPRRKASVDANGNAAEDKRSEEVATDDDDDLDQQMIDRLIEISSKLHLPADDVVEIISDVEEKKKKRKELPPPGKPVVPRFRPLVPPPLAGPPIYHYTASSNPKKALYKANRKWQKDKNKAKSYKQEYWYKPQKQVDYWYKPQKQFLAFPSYPYYQKPYRAYYPVYFPYPKASGYYDKTSLPRDQQLFVPQDYGFQPPRRRHRAGVNARGQGWRQQPPPRLPATPYISNYILPHPRTYQPLPPPKPRSPSGRGRQPPFYYPPAPGDDYEEDGLEPQLDSDEELENFIERIYMKRRMY
ncbi:neurosecretory protein VGF [Osmerus eperlanus]|uniref:neurosecretory protein VGF n=1 Tax=Osmerus eperlanus TaxID=29151 RepID=UPI002E108B7E